MCLYPKLIKNKKYSVNKKNNGIIPEIKDERTKWVPVGCGNCEECRKQYARQWQIRLQKEIVGSRNGKFITLTFSNEELNKLKKIVGDEGNAIAILAMRRFLERWRKKYKMSVKHWFATELGHNGTERIHLHGILWTNESNEEIEKLWKYGHIWVGDYVNEKTVNYIIKYITKVDRDHVGFKSRILTSAGIGKRYLNTEDARNNRYKKEGTRETIRLNNGVSVNLPIYYRNKIYSEEEREKLWIEKLNKGEIYIKGNKYNIKTDEGLRQYQKDLKYYQSENIKLGYGSDEMKWNRKKYNASLREINNENKWKNKDLIK